MVRHVATEGHGAVPGGLVTSQAIRGSQVVVVIRVALRTGCRRVGTDKSESSCTVIKGRCGPGDSRVAIDAIRRGIGWTCG